LPRKPFTICLHPEIQMAFKLLCDRAGYTRMNEAIEWMMLQAIEAGNLPIPPRGSRELELVRKVDLLHKVTEIRRRLKCEN